MSPTDRIVAPAPESAGAASVRGWRGGPPLLLGLLAAAALVGCGPESTAPRAGDDGATLTLRLRHVPALVPEVHGSYEAWVVEPGGGVRSAGRFQGHPAGSASVTVTLESPVADPVEVFVTVEPPGDVDGTPSTMRFVGGPVQGGRAELDHNAYLTPGVPLQPTPGTHVLFTPSNNQELGGVDTFEDAGVWMFNIDAPGGARPDNPDYYLTYTPLSPGWVYEGWIVRDHGTDDAVWLAYGKFQPSPRQKADSMDSAGFGPFSGRLRPREVRFEHEIAFPGADWVSNPFGLPVPGGLSLPLDLNGCRAGPEACEAAGQEYGDSRYTHVVTIEPRSELEEDRWLDGTVAPENAMVPEPFPLFEPYRNPIGNAPPSEPRTIEYHPEGVPAGTAELGS